MAQKNSISEITKNYLQKLAQKYETADFSDGDPSFILNYYNKDEQTEAAAFITALLSFGQRQQFLKKVDYILSLAQSDFCLWLKSGKWQNDFPSGTKKFYRFYSFDDMRLVFARMQNLLQKYNTFGEAVKAEYQKQLAILSDTAGAEFSNINRKSGSQIQKALVLAGAVSDLFSDCKIVPHGKQCANKRLHMYFRWMVRKNSPVDKGFWNWFDQKDLIIPLDTHVLQEAKKLNLIRQNAPASAKTAAEITDALKTIWPDDPVKGDFALFGSGVDTTASSVGNL